MLLGGVSLGWCIATEMPLESLLAMNLIVVLIVIVVVILIVILIGVDVDGASVGIDLRCALRLSAIFN